MHLPRCLRGRYHLATLSSFDILSKHFRQHMLEVASMILFDVLAWTGQPIHSRVPLSLDKYYAQVASHAVYCPRIAWGRGLANLQVIRL